MPSCTMHVRSSMQTIPAEPIAVPNPAKESKS